MGAAIVLLLVGLGALAAGVLIGRYYVPDDRQLRRTARHGRAFMRALSHLIARDHDTVVRELRTVVEENIDDVEPYFALGAMFRSRGEHERAIRVHQALAIRERDKKKLRTRAMYELGMDFRGAGMPRRATRAMEEVLLEEPSHEGALRSLAALYEEQGRFAEAADLWRRLGRRRGEDLSEREHHLIVAAAQTAIARGELDAAKDLLKDAQRLARPDGAAPSAHFYAAAAELAAARGNPRGARERIKQALAADPGVVVQLLPGLLAAEERLAASAAPAATEAPAPAAADELADAPESAEGVAVQAAPAAAAPGTSAAERAAATLAEVERQTGPRIELALARAQLGGGEAARALRDGFPGTLAAHVVAARGALASGEPAQIAASLSALAAEGGALAWAIQGRWRCAQCQARPEAFGWRCGQCRRWGTLGVETGVEPPAPPARERRAAPRAGRPEHALPSGEPAALALRGATPDTALPAPTLTIESDDLGRIAPPRSLLGRVGGWVAGVWRRGA